MKYSTMRDLTTKLRGHFKASERIARQYSRPKRRETDFQSTRVRGK